MSSDRSDDVFDDAGFGAASAAFWALVILGGVALFLWDFSGMISGSLSPAGFPINYIDNLKVTLMSLEMLGGGGTIVVMAYVLWRYAAPKRDSPKALIPGTGKNVLTMWTIGVLFLMAMAIFMGAGTLALTDQNAHPAQTVHTDRQLNMEVVGSQWVWRMDVDGVPYTESENLVVPANTLLNFNVTSGDVIHSFAIQELGIKKDAIPGQVNHASFMVDHVDGETNIRAGDQKIPADEYQINCAELCGKGHSKMVANMYVVSPQDYRTWVQAQGGTVPDSFETKGGS
ncbi:MAG: cytochrome c oxidase subunit II [Salinigranum sp.]